MIEVAGWVIATAVGLGWFGGAASMMIMGWREGITGLLCLGALGVLLGVGFSIILYGEAYPPAGVKIVSLRGDQWACTDTHREVHTTYVMVGKIMTPITSVSNVCIQWNRR